MKFVTSISTILICFSSVGQRFGEFASAIKIDNCGTNQFHNTTGAGVNCINTTCGTVFNGVSFGSFNQNSSGLFITGGEIKTWKAADGNVCGARLNYVVYPTGSRPGSPSYTAINLPFKCGCSVGNFTDGLGPCGDRDQKWSIETSSINLTTRAPGDYTLEIYYDYDGSDFNTSDCNNPTRYINNGGNPTNYTATFTIVASGATCGLLPVELVSFDAICMNNNIQINWSTNSERENDYYILESSSDGINWNFDKKISGQGTTTSSSFYSENISYTGIPNYIRLIQVDYNGVQNNLMTKAVSCTDFEEFQIFPNPNSGSFEVTFIGNSKEEEIDLVIYDAKGALVYMENHTTFMGLNKISVSKDFAEGVYFVNLVNHSKTSEFRKLIIR